MKTLPLSSLLSPLSSQSYYFPSKLSSSDITWHLLLLLFYFTFPHPPTKMSSSSSNIRYRGPLCGCGVLAPLRASNQDPNRGRRFFGCINLCCTDPPFLATYPCGCGYDAGAGTGYAPDSAKKKQDTARSERGRAEEIVRKGKRERSERD